MVTGTAGRPSVRSGAYQPGFPIWLHFLFPLALPSEPRDAGGRNAASPARPNLTPGMARVTGAKASVHAAIAL